MSRYRFTCYYDGRSYWGWQSQPDVKTIQDALEKTFSHVLEQSITIHGAGRTDRGVHALGQVAHFDVEGDVSLPSERWQDLINDRLPTGVSIYQLEEADASFHARHDATRRYYGYRFRCRRNRDGSDGRRSWVLERDQWKPNRSRWIADRYNEGVPTAVFSGQGGSSHQSDTWPVRCVVRRRTSHEFWLLVSARSFKYRMVR